MRVLVVEDDKMCQTAISNMAKKMTFLELAFANDGKEAVQKASEIEFSLILMDMYMPEMTGIDATKIIRESTINKNSVIVSLSGGKLIINTKLLSYI